ncbi:hypothetical protein MtrunA17_Chr3g0145271 [Medicago truncatula]|uniref:Uncharacterized protein n=1 Tax=Medicago truncatula TaxID=3880 RepID=A0A396J865_MEDTR|nr:hypothetical protein MtrunA17_Chr3g0145271 [Medicago truncatula]
MQVPNVNMQHYVGDYVHVDMLAWLYPNTLRYCGMKELSKCVMRTC